MCIPYYKDKRDFVVIWEPLNPTGRWKLVTNEYYTNKLYIEHKGFLFKRWISEEDIEFFLKREERIFDCNSR